VFICTLLFGLTLAQNADAQPRPIPHLGSMSGVGDSELGLQWNGSDSFANPYARYFFKDNVAAEIGAELDFLNFDDSDINPSHLEARGGLLYELKDNPAARCYVGMGGLYQRDVFDQGGDKVTQNDFGAYFNIGGDVRVRKGWYLGMAAGAQFTTFSSDIEVGGSGTAVDGASGTKLWAGIHPRINLTYHFARPRITPLA